MHQRVVQLWEVPRRVKWVSFNPLATTRRCKTYQSKCCIACILSLSMVKRMVEACAATVSSLT